MVATIVGIVSDRLLSPAIWLFGISPAASPLFAATLSTTESSAHSEWRINDG